MEASKAESFLQLKSIHWQETEKFMIWEASFCVHNTEFYEWKEKFGGEKKLNEKESLWNPAYFNPPGGKTVIYFWERKQK